MTITQTILDKMKSYLLIIYMLISCQQSTIHEKTPPNEINGNPGKIEQVRFQNGTIGFSGTLFFPAGNGPFTAIAITHGSGKDSKDHPGFIDMAKQFSANNVVALIYDKRGVGESGGVYTETPKMEIPAGDLVAAVQYLKSREEVNPLKIGVYGHSQGGWVAPLAATMSEDINFLVVSCGGGVSIKKQILYANRSDLKAKGFTDTEIEEIVTFASPFYDYLGTGLNYENASESYNEHKNKSWFVYFKSLGFGENIPGPGSLSHPVFDFFKAIQYDPMMTEKSLTIPTLVMLGEKDAIVPSTMVETAWKTSFDGKNNLTIKIIPNEDHYDFVRIEGNVVYKQSFKKPLMGFIESIQNR